MTRNDFLKRIEKDKITEDLAEFLKREQLPLILWGCGDVGASVFDYLKKCGVVVDSVWLDGKQGESRFREIEVLSRQEILEKYAEFNVILGHSHYEMAEPIKRELPQIRNVFCMASVSYEQYEKVPYAAAEQEAGRFAALADRLADAFSVRNLFAYLNTKITGDYRYILEAYEKESSFFHNDVFCVGDSEVYLDIGAYDGDTIRQFLEETGGSYKKMIALEPDDRNFLELGEYLSAERLRNVIISKAGAWNKTEDIRFQAGNEQISGVAMGDEILKSSRVITIHADRMDEMFAGEDITVIKINYFEGVLEALEGCRGILESCRPRMALTVGFDLYNVLKLSEYIASLKLGYRMYLRFNRAMSSALTLYAAV